MNYLINTDCNDIIGWLGKDFFDLALLDPPYGINESSKDHNSRNTFVLQSNGKRSTPKNKNYHRSNWDSNIPSDTYFENILRISKNAIIFGANYYPQFTPSPENLQNEPNLTTS